MSDVLKDLNNLFLNFGSGVKPGDDLDWRTFELPVENDVSFLNLVKTEIDGINRDSEKKNQIVSPFCNPVIIIFHKLEFIARYFAGEFEIQTKNKKLREDFAKIWYEFIKGWYFGSIYVAYGADFEAVDREKFSQEGKNFELEGVTGKFRLYTSNSGNNFHSVLSGQAGLKFDREKQARMVKCDFKGFYNWLYWWKLWAEWLEGMARYKTSVEALSKNLVLTPKNEADFNSVRSQFSNYDCFIKREGNQNFGTDTTPQMGKTKFEEIICMPLEAPGKILEGVQRAFELNAQHLGFAGKFAEQKKERINAGENFPHQKVVSNIRTHMLTQLNSVFDEMRKKFGSEVIPDDLKIVPTNQAFAQGLPEFQQGGTFNNFGNNGFSKWPRWGNNFKEDFRGND